MAETIAIRTIRPIEIQIGDSKVFARLKELLKEGIRLLTANTTNEEKANIIVNDVAEHISNNHSGRFPKDSKKEKEKIKVHIAKTTEEAIDRLVGEYEQMPGINATELAIIRKKAEMEFKKKKSLGLYDENTTLLVINLQEIIRKYKDADWQDACFHITTIHEVLHHFGGFEYEYKNRKLSWLNEGLTEVLTRKIAQTEYGYIVMDRWDTAYNDLVVVTKNLMDVVGEEALYTAFFNRTFKPIEDKLLELGFNDKEIEKMLRLGSGCVESADAFKKFDMWLIRMKKKARTSEAKTEGEEEIAISGELRDKLAEKNLLPAQAEADHDNLSSMDQVIAQIMKNYNSPSVFYANLALETAIAHLTIQASRAPTVRETSLFLEEAAQEFSRIHTVKPTVRQLAFAVVEEAYYSYSHNVSVYEFFDVTGYTAAEVKRFVKDVAMDWEYLKLTGGEKTDEETAKRMGISASSKDELAGMFWGATIVAMACNPPVVNEISVIEALAAAKAKHGVVSRKCNSDEIIRELIGALDRNGSNPKFIRHMARLAKTDVEAYFNNHYYKKPDDETVKAMNVLVGNLALAYPAAAIRFDAKRGFTRYMGQLGDGDNLLFPVPPGGTNSAGTMGKFTPYGKNSFSRILRQHGLPTDINPLFSGENVEKARKAQKRDYKRSDLEQVVDVYKEYKTDGRKGIKCDMESERPNGCLTPEEVLERGYALCLEHACLFMALNEGIKSRVLAFKVFKDEDGNPIPHICNGVIIDEKQISVASYAFEALAHRRARKTYYLFDEDQEFRENLMARAGISDSEKRLILLDLSMQNFGAQYQEVRPILTDEELLSAHFVDRGSYYMRTAEQEKALENFEAALKINPMDELARSHLIAYYSDIHQDPARVLELSHDPNLLVNTEDFVSRALVLVSLGRSDEAVEALLRALQLSESAVKAKLLLKDISKLVS